MGSQLADCSDVIEIGEWQFDAIFFLDRTEEDHRVNRIKAEILRNAGAVDQRNRPIELLLE